MVYCNNCLIIFLVWLKNESYMDVIWVKDWIIFVINDIVVIYVIIEKFLESFLVFNVFGILVMLIYEGDIIYL